MLRFCDRLRKSASCNPSAISALAADNLLRYSGDMATAAILEDRQSPWRDELRATLVLAWPLILTNVTMVLINSTDVFLLAQLGPDALAASALGTGILFAMMLVGIGIVIAGSPLMAAELGRKSYSVRDIRRTFRQSM